MRTQTWQTYRSDQSRGDEIAQKPKATQPDETSAKLLKETAEQISPAFTLLFQASLHQGRIPSSWKKALVVFIYKKGGKSSHANYIPIDILGSNHVQAMRAHCTLCYHLYHLMNHGILSDSQHGFRKRRSYEKQLVITINDLAKGLEDKDQFDVILLYFSKAFGFSPTSPS